MFGNIGWSELFIIAALALVVIGPKELPTFLRVAGRYFGKMKGFAEDFRSQFDDVVRDTQIAEIKDNILKEVEDAKAALPSEQDIGLDFTELDDAEKKSASQLEDDEDENLDWDEPDEVIETSADGEVIHHSKKDPSESDDETEAVASPDQDGQQLAAQDKEGLDNKSVQKAADEHDDDDGALLDEEEYQGEARTSKEILEEGRQKFQQSVKAEREEAAVAKRLERVQKTEKREAAMAASDRRGV